MRPRSVYALILSAILLVAGTAAADWVSPSGDAPSEPRVSATAPASVVTVDLSIPGFDLRTVDIDGVPHASIALPGASPLMVRGYPELPVLARSIEIPGSGACSVRLVDEVWDEMPVDPVVPSKGHLTRDMDPGMVAWTFADLYRDGGEWPTATAELTEPFIVRDARGVTVRVMPFRYDADRGVLRVLRSARLEVSVKGIGMNEMPTATRRADGQFERIYDGLFLNRDAAKYTAIDEPGRMLIVTDDAFQGAMYPFVEWKQQRGLDVEMITTSSIGGTATGIQTAITTRFNEPEGLTYVILVGDITQVPTNSGTVEGADSDPTYAMVAGSDLYPDLFISRISANSLTEVQLQVSKFIRYERDPDTGVDAAWYHMGTGLASNEGSPTDYERANWLRDDMLAYTFTHVDQIYQPTGTSAMIAAALNEGRSLVNYIGHGSGVSWSNPPFGVSDINALSNGWKQPWLLDVSCSNGDFSNTTCFAEAWLRAGTVAQPKGAVASYSASTLASWVPPCVMQAHAVDLLVADAENTLGALYFFGGMQVLDDYPGATGEGAKLIEQYNIFGDCSLVVRTDEPTAIAAVHQPAVFLNSPTFDVDVAGEGGLTVAIYAGGVLHGTAVTDAAGHATITFDVPVATPGDVTLTVTGYNRVPYIATLPAINPSTVVLDPTSIDAGVTTAVTVTVYGSDGVTPMPDVTVWAEGLDYASASVVTDAAGQAVLSVTYPYGPSLDVVGQEIGETYELFREVLGVNAMALSVPDLNVTTTFGMSDQFGLNLPGTLVATVAEPGATLFALMPGGGSSSVAGTSLEVTPAALGQVTGVIAVSGYDVYSEAFDVVEAYGTLSGHVDAAGSPAVGAVVRGLDGGGAEVFSAVTNASGDYAVATQQLVDTYTLVVDVFGYLHWEESYFLGYGANVKDIALVAAPSGTLSGAVTEVGSGAPLAATVKAYRSDDGSLYAQTDTDPLDGSFALGLTYFDYDIQVTSSGHVPVTVAVTVDAPSVVKDFVLDVTSGNILIIDDAGAARMTADKYDDKGRELLESGYAATADRSASTMSADLTALGYSVTVETIGATDPATWSAYDLIVSSSGANTANLADATVRNALIAHCQGGGRLLLEGGEVAYEWRSDTAMAADVMHISAWNGDSSGSVTVHDAAHPVMSTPNAVVGPIGVSYSGYGDQDRVTVAADADMIGAWSSYASNASVIAYDSNALPTAGDMVFFLFNYDAMDAPARAGLLQNAVTWLLGSEVGDCALDGTVYQVGGTPLAGATVELLPSGDTTITDATGHYAFTGLFPGTFTVRASKADWSTEQTDVTLAQGESLSGVDLVLSPVVTVSECGQPGAVIPDNDPAGLDIVIPMAGSMGETVSTVSLYVDITHPYIGDLWIDLIAPDGTVCGIHHNQGYTADDILGWYPVDLTPLDDLGMLNGTQMAGEWTLHLHDTGPYDWGTLNEFCLEITYTAVTTGVEDAPSAFALSGNVPNPFNPSTTIAFSLPREGRAELRVYDLAGRLVRTLLDETLPAAEHSVQWHGRDDLGRTVPSGTYYYRLVTADGMAVRKMTLIK